MRETHFYINKDMYDLQTNLKDVKKILPLHILIHVYFFYIYTVFVLNV